MEGEYLSNVGQAKIAKEYMSFLEAKNALTIKGSSKNCQGVHEFPWPFLLVPHWKDTFPLFSL